MKRVLCSAFLLAMVTLPAVGAAAGSEDACQAHAAAMLETIVRGDFEGALANFDSTMAHALTATQISDLWRGLQASLGPYHEHGKPWTVGFHGGAVVFTPVDFAKSRRVLEVACGENGAVGGLHVLSPGQARSISAQLQLLDEQAEGAHVPVRAHEQPDGVRVVPFDVPSPAGPLRGALTLPAGKGPFPAVVMASGSGNNDMDETIGPNKPFRDIADGLAKAGVASLRFDKRTMDHAQRSLAQPGFTVDDEETDDVLTAVRLLAKHPGIASGEIFVLGHSQGAMLAPRIARRDPRLAGIVMLAAPARPLLEVLAWQVREEGRRTGASAAEIAQREQAIRTEQALLAKADPRRPPQGMFMVAPQSWWLSLHDYHQVATAKSLTLPILILQGANDIQVSPARDFDLWKKALAGKPNVTFHLYPGLSHLFMPGPARSAADYDKPAHVDPEVILDIAHWIKAQPPAR